MNVSEVLRGAVDQDTEKRLLGTVVRNVSDISREDAVEGRNVWAVVWNDRSPDS